MSQTQVPAGSALARKLYSVALFAQTQKANGFAKNLTGNAPNQASAESKIKGQTSPDMPIVRVTDLSKTAGDKISLDCFGVIGGAPLMGDTNAEGRGEKLSSSSMEVSIDLMTKVVDAGGKMGQQRTLHDLRGIASAQLTSYFSRLNDQLTLSHLAGARGSQAGNDWAVPLATAWNDTTLGSVAVNPIKAPSYNRHFVASATSMVQGGAALSAVANTALLKLSHLDQLRTLLDEMEYPLQPVKISDDPAAADEPMWVMYVSPRQWSSLLTETAGIRAFQQNAWNRASYGSKHPLFKGEVGMWNGILVKKLNRAIRFAPAASVAHITSANAATATETAVTVNGSLGAGFAIDRAILLGAQALANVYGKNKSSDYYFSWYENPYNFDRAMEIAGDVMGGMAKVRFDYDESGVATPTDHGVIAFDTAVAL